MLNHMFLEHESRGFFKLSVISNLYFNYFNGFENTCMHVFFTK